MKNSTPLLPFLVWIALPLGMNAETAGDYEYTVTNGEATITDHSGSGGDEESAP